MMADDVAVDGERREDAARDGPGMQADTRGRTRMLTRRRRAFRERRRTGPGGQAVVFVSRFGA
ncbi:hypothetical protein DIE16_25625 [Burkholderia sp. Bp9090]|nr:hypothetical protein DIE09_15610 [Burkholderia sp. Bp9010]RQS67144.1 hypothetical protein DID97_28865 [Burkholderia sp. Bp8977]RQZ32276.1 hypothetical protein DIE16_25625 [Burkholderia sp. Bp9090]